MKSTITRITDPTIFLGPLTVISLTTVGLVTARRNRPPARVGYTLTEVERVYPANGSAPFIASTSTRYEKSDGTWRKDADWDGRPQLIFSRPDRGVFNVQEQDKKLQYVGLPANTILTEELLRRDPHFVREENLYGWKTFVLQTSALDDSEFDEDYMCPALQYPLKRVRKLKSGTLVISDVTQVTLGEPSETLFTSLPNYPVRSGQPKN